MQLRLPLPDLVGIVAALARIHRMYSTAPKPGPFCPLFAPDAWLQCCWLSVRPCGVCCRAGGRHMLSPLHSVCAHREGSIKGVRLWLPEAHHTMDAEWARVASER